MVGATALGGRYRVEEKVASGAMGTVYAGTDDRLGRRVAIKILKDELAADAAFVERFRREARAAAALSHPSIANVFDYGRDGETHFIVMELVEGRDLARLIREEGPLDAERVGRIAAQVCSALEHAHASGVVHRDVKPANVMVSEDDRVKVTDFGIARAAGDSTLTATGSVIGTAHYISPEQAQGAAIGPGSDLYSLGIVVYEMLTGSVPFTGDSLVVVAMRHVSDDVPPPSELNQDVPPELDAVVLRACAKDPLDRFSSAAAMRAALSGEPESPTAALATSGADTAVITDAAERGPSVPLPVGHWDPRRIGAIALITLGTLALIATGLLVWRVTSDEPQPRREQRAAADGGRSSPARSTPPEVGIEIPGSLIGLHVDTAREVLHGLGFDRIENVHADPEDHGFEDIPENVVIATDPAPGDTASPSQTITLVLSQPKDDKSGPGNSGNGEGHGKDKDKEED